jgi:signal transduction histidine kinase
MHGYKILRGSKLIDAEEKERARIGRELHDDIGQRLALLNIELSEIQHLPKLTVECRTAISHLSGKFEEIIRDVHALSHDMHPSQLEFIGLAPAIRGFCREFSERHRFEVDLKCEGVPGAIPSHTALCLFRVLQESIHNSQKHSGRNSCKVRLWGSGGQIHLTIGDSGKGFENNTAEGRGGLGLISMSERLKSVSGTLSVESQPLRGTSVRASVPCKTPVDLDVKNRRAKFAILRNGVSQKRRRDQTFPKTA